ncbi:histidine phosphatase family protein [Cellulomonas palmilytica]|uniref:histidine phosphatase family protein n=1 Tax=Cellulomonas palmilytica TaxID=2608402 RepID=UPI001F3281CB|nr:histidine phosphatase family protein [Cellulomonas palmilytica]UJP40835.1 histidine phosphatase family protein [Cellulomonas palmilytica]
MTLTLTLVRHGRTHFNARRVLQGRCDSPLTREGRAGVRVTARHLAGTPFTAAWSSPSGRAVSTAVELLRHHEGVRLRTHPDLREYHFGAYERRPEHELDAVLPWAALVEQVLAGTHPGLPGGEHAADFMRRTTSVFAHLVEQHLGSDAHVLVVGHGLALGAWLATLAPVGLVALPNASVTTVEVDAAGTPRIASLAEDVAAQGTLAARPALAPVA